MIRHESVSAGHAVHVAKYLSGFGVWCEPCQVWVKWSTETLEEAVRLAHAHHAEPEAVHLGNGSER